MQISQNIYVLKKPENVYAHKKMFLNLNFLLYLLNIILTKPYFPSEEKYFYIKNLRYKNRNI